MLLQPLEGCQPLPLLDLWQPLTFLWELWQPLALLKWLPTQNLQPQTSCQATSLQPLVQPLVQPLGQPTLALPMMMMSTMERQSTLRSNMERQSTLLQPPPQSAAFCQPPP